MSDIIQSLWIGGSLSKLEQLCLKSFCDNGHTVHLYTYSDVKNIPKEVIVKDGNEILPENEIFRYKNGSVSAFSNLFRLTLLYKRGGYWADTDLICVKPFKSEDDYVFSSEPNELYNNNIITSSFIKMPKGSKVALRGINIQKEQKKLILSGEVPWGSGPKTVQTIVQEFNLFKYVLPWKATCNCYYDHFITLFISTFKPRGAITTVKEIPNEMICIHLWNELIRRQNINKDSTFDPNSIIEYFKRKHNII